MDHEQTPVSEKSRTSYSKMLISQMKIRAKERSLSNKTIMEAAWISQSTYYRFWNSELAYPMISLDDAINICAFLDLSIDALYRPVKEIPTSNLPILDGPRNEIMENTAKMLAERKEAIESLESESVQLHAKISEKDARIAELDAETRALHNRIHDLNREHAERLDRLYAELSKRNQQLLDLLESR